MEEPTFETKDDATFFESIFNISLGGKHIDTFYQRTIGYGIGAEDCGGKSGYGI